MDARNLIHPMTAGDLVQSACVLGIVERGMGAETEVRILECVSIEPHDDKWALDRADGQLIEGNARATCTFRDRGGTGRVQLELKASTPLLFTRISM